MGSDKALLPHPLGGTWLEQSLRRLTELGIPVTLLSRHSQHLDLTQQLAQRLGKGSLIALNEPAPWEGPLLALHRLMQQHPNQRLLLCPVDMPGLSLRALQTMLANAEVSPSHVHVAHDGRRLQPLLGLYPSSHALRDHLADSVRQGERRLQNWLAVLPEPPLVVKLDPQAIRNVNRADELSTQRLQP